MIHSLAVTNFRSIKDTCLMMNFAEGKAPHGYKDSSDWAFIQQGKNSRDRVCPVLMLYGANASGKTTMLLAIDALCSIVRSGWDRVFHQPYALGAQVLAESPSLFAVEFWINRRKYSYEIAVDATGISAEKLAVDSAEIYSIEKSKLNSLTGLGEKFSKDISDAFSFRCVDAKTSHQMKTFLSEITSAFPGLSKELISAKDYLVEDVLFLQGEVPFSLGIDLLAGTFTNKSRSEQERLAVELILDYLHKLDVPIAAMKIDKDTAEHIFKGIPNGHPIWKTTKASDVLYSVSTAHINHNGDLVWLDYMKESNGTRRLIGFLGFLLAAVRTGKTVCVDGIDESLHSLLVLELIRLFKKKDVNNLSAQLIATIHNTDVLSADVLGLSEIGVVAQRGFEGSKITRLAEISGLRNSDNLRRRYLRGEFGGIPFPYL